MSKWDGERLFHWTAHASLPGGFLGIIARDRPRAHLVISPSLLNTPIHPSIDVEVVIRAAVPLELKSLLLPAHSH